jgi:hypothetical protein
VARENINSYTSQNKQQALVALHVQIEAIPEKMKIRIAVPLEFITTAQTKVCMLTHNKNHRSKVSVNLPV